MKQKIFLTLLLSTVVSVSAFTGCSKESTQESSTEITESQTETTVEDPGKEGIKHGLVNYKTGIVQNISLERYSQDLEEGYGIISAFGEDGGLIWQYTTPPCAVTQYENISEIGKCGDKYYYAYEGVLVALNQTDGTIAWENEDLQGYGVKGAFDANGVAFLTTEGPNLVVVDAKGNTLKVIESFEEGCCHPIQVEMKDGYVWVTMEIDWKQLDGSGAVFRVDPNNYTYERVQ